MVDTVGRWIRTLSEMTYQKALLFMLGPIVDRCSSKMCNAAGLVIKSGGSALVKTGATACHAICRGVLRSIAAATDMAALSGSVTNAKFNVYVYFIDGAGALTSAMGVEGATLAAVVWPPIPENKAVIGFTIINPTGTGPFVGGTTAIDDGTVVPNAVHVSLTSSFDPSIVM